MTREQIAAQVAAAVAEEADKKPDEIRPEDRFVEDLAFDSLSLVELVMELEDNFKLSIPDDDVQNLKSVGQVIDYIETELAKSPAA